MDTENRRLTKRIVLCLAVLAPSWAAAADVVIIIPRDDRPFTAAESNVVRLRGNGITGARIDATVEGPARVVATNQVVELTAGEPVIDLTVKEFDVQPTGKGKVNVTITVTPPQPGAPMGVTRYSFAVK